MMTKQQQQLSLLGAGLVLLVLVYARALYHPSPGAEAVPAAGAPAAVQASGAASGGLITAARSTAREAQRQRAGNLVWGRDPFTRSALGQISGLALSGILWDPSQPIAIINGQMLRVGEEIDGFRVVQIEQDHVGLSDGGQTFSLTLTP